MKQHLPSIRELAAQLGLGHNTVARALRNAPRVAPETRKRVLKAAATAGYRVNPLVTALMSEVRRRRRTRPSGEVLAFITAESTEHGWKTLPSHVNQFEGARAKAMAAGFDLQPMWLGNQSEHSRQLARIMANRGVRGALLAPVPVPLEKEIELDWAHMAIVALGYSFQQVPLHRAAHDGIRLVSDCYTQLHEIGHRRIGIVMDQRYGLRGRHLFINGFLGAQWWYKSRTIPPLLIDDATGKQSLMRWLETKRPDALIGIWPDQPLSWMVEYGIKVPHDISYATIDAEGEQGKQMAGMVQNNHALGAAAMDMLTGQIFRNEVGSPAEPIVTLVKGTWQAGLTVRTRQK